MVEAGAIFRAQFLANTLTKKQRAAIRLVRGGMKPKEITEKTGKSYAAIYRLLARSKSHLEKAGLRIDGSDDSAILDLI